MTNAEASKLLVQLYAEWYKTRYESEDCYSEAVTMAVGALMKDGDSNG